MARGEVSRTRVHFRGESDDFIVFVDDESQCHQWKKDQRSVPLSHFVSSFQIFCTNHQGPNGQLNEAPNSLLDNEFGTHNEDEVIKKILTSGSMQTRDHEHSVSGGQVGGVEDFRMQTEHPET
ncbi:SDO1-like protein C21C3.19 [Ceratocystis lukuohia]|uniref:SDO1-like protein C21C3.19 n=1 Tax=Ceratocystis lukuohia TaxID=2019550 RepID=A0ABR4MCB7_9PEZI